MKKLLLCGALAAGCCLTSPAQGKINNAGNVRLGEYKLLKQEMTRVSPQRAAALDTDVTVYVTLTPDATVGMIEDLGYTVVDSTADIAIVKLPISQVETLAANEWVKSVDFGYEASPMMDMARNLSFADGIHEGTAEGLTRAYRGAGVYVGLYDTGLDPNHVNFTDANGNSRVKAVYLSRLNSGVSKYETPEEVKLFETDDKTQTHGTHVLGTITGRSDVPGTYAIRENNQVVVKDGAIPYYGVAPDADILVGCGDFYDATINAGIGAVVDRAKQDGKPVIVNLSLGHNRGSHDPRETVNRYLDSRAADAIIVVAAGNEGGSLMSIERNFTNASNFATTIVPTNTTTARTMYTAEFWSDTETPFTADLILFDKVNRNEIVLRKITDASGSATINANSNSDLSAHFNTATIQASWGKDSSTDRFNLYMSNTVEAKDGDFVFGVRIYGVKGQRVNAYCDAYDGYSADEVRFINQTGLNRSISGTDVGSINGMACGYNTISVGAWVSRTTMPNLSGAQATYNAGTGVGSIAGFSSYGTSGDGRQLPIVCAPGAQIISSISSFNTSYPQSGWSAKADHNGKTYGWYYMQGTSMATPFVSGALALWLEAWPEMRGTDAQDIIAKTSIKDAYSGKTEDAARWGYGKINVLAGLQEAVRRSASVNTVLADEADQNLMVTNKGGKLYEVSCPGVNNLSCTLYNLQGAAVANAATDGDTIDLDASSVAEGIYVLSVDAAGQKLSRKVVVK